MGDYLSTDFVNKTEKLKETLNNQLNMWSAPTLGESDNEYDRTRSFVAINEWFSNAEKHELEALSQAYGLLPVIYSLSGINVLHATLLQETSRLDVVGIITYIRVLLKQSIGNDRVKMRELCETFFPDYLSTDECVDDRSLFISLLISYCMNTRDDITYPQALSRVLYPITA